MVEAMLMKDRTFQALVRILVQTLVRTGEEAEELHGADDGDGDVGRPSRFLSLH